MIRVQAFQKTKIRIKLLQKIVQIQQLGIRQTLKLNKLEINLANPKFLLR